MAALPSAGGQLRPAHAPCNSLRDPPGDGCTADKAPPRQWLTTPPLTTHGTKRANVHFHRSERIHENQQSGTPSLHMHHLEPSPAVNIHERETQCAVSLSQQPSLTPPLLLGAGGGGAGAVKTNTQESRQKAEEGGAAVLRTLEQDWVQVLPLLELLSPRLSQGTPPSARYPDDHLVPRGS